MGQYRILSFIVDREKEERRIFTKVDERLVKSKGVRVQDARQLDLHEVQSSSVRYVVRQLKSFWKRKRKGLQAKKILRVPMKLS